MDKPFNSEREHERMQLANRLWLTPYAVLLRYGIGSFRDVTKLDKIGIPVWISCRPLARSISINAGKGDHWLMGFAGAITEAMEFWAAENPWGECTQASHAELEQAKSAEILPFNQYPLARDALCDAGMTLSWEKVDRLTAGDAITEPLCVAKAWMPSDCVWLEQRAPTQFVNFQSTSNGVAAGVQYADAVLSALYELVERDGWTLNQCLIETTGQWPTKVPLEGLPHQLAALVEAMRAAGVYPFLFDVTSNFGIPIFGCTLFDPTDSGGIGTFGGYGCSLNPVHAAKRALLESVQSRLCYISGARDDMFRRDFILLKKAEQKKALETAEELPCAASWSEHVEDYGTPYFETIAQELHQLLVKLVGQGVDKIYARQLCEEHFGDAKLVIVRVIAPQMEAIKFDHWKSNGRALAFLKQRAA
jgi:ribosomal protein S12 methylthiotransferase accessory factor